MDEDRQRSKDVRLILQRKRPFLPKPLKCRLESTSAEEKLNLTTPPPPNVTQMR
jgi:hypothetical protein